MPKRPSRSISSRRTASTRLPPRSNARVSSRRTTKPTLLDKPTSGEIAATKRLFDQIPNDELVAALHTCDDERAPRLLAVLSDPVYSKHSMEQRIRVAGMTVAEVLRAVTTMHHTDADLRVSRRLPAIMEQMAEESKPHLIACPKCQLGASLDEAIAGAIAASMLDADWRCQRCHNRGVVLVDGDNDVRKMILETQGKLGARGPLVDARSIHMHGSGARAFAPPDMADWSRSTDVVFEGRIAATQTPLLAAPVDEAETV